PASSPSGNIIGNRAFAVADVSLTGTDSSTATVDPPSAIGDNLPKTVTIQLTGIRDILGTLLPDGARVAASTIGNCFNRDRQGNCVNSAGGIIVNGVQSPDIGMDDRRIRVLQVMNGQVTIQYDPRGVLVPVEQTLTANVSALPARPDGTIIGNRAFTVAP